MAKTKDLSFFLGEAAELIDRDQGLRQVQAAMDRIAHVEYQLPPSLSKLQWMRTYRTTAPYNALKGGTRALTTLEEKVNIEPISVLKAVPGYDDDTGKARSLANEWETCLRWLMKRAAARGGVWREDLIRSALLYDEVCAKVTHLPTQLKVMAQLKGNTRRVAALLRHGPFAVTIHNPQTVHVRYSDFLAEGVLSVTCRTPQQIVDIWGEAAARLQRKLDEDDAADSYLLCDYQGYAGRCVWALPGDDEAALVGADEDDDELVQIVKPTEIKYPFLQWVTVSGGTNLESDPARQRQPLFYPIYRSELVLNANVTGSLMTSEAIAEFGKPKIKRSGPDPSSVEVDMGAPGGTYDTPPGHDVTPLPKEGLDPAIRELFDRHITEINETTVARILVTGEAQPGEPFASLNQRFLTAVGSLKPFKQTGERALTRIYENMLLWCHHSGQDLEGYSVENGNSRGKKYRIDSEDIDPDNLHLAAEFQTDVPVDRLQQIAGAVQLARELPVDAVYLLEQIGIDDPDQMIARRQKQDLKNAYFQGHLQMIMAQSSGQIQQMAQQLAMEMQQQQAEAAQDPNAMGGMGQLANPQDPSGGMGVPGAEGGMFAPSAGGLPPALLSPAGATREGATGTDRSGNPLAGL